MDKQQQKQLITEIMNDDAKDGLYKQQTAVTKFRNELAKILPSNLDADVYKRIYAAYEQAKQIERERTEISFLSGQKNGWEAAKDLKDLMDSSDYYTQTYGE